MSKEGKGRRSPHYRPQICQEKKFTKQGDNPLTPYSCNTKTLLFSGI